MRRSSICLLTGLLAAVASQSLLAADWPQWRGPGRNGIARETGLLPEWPKDGPKLVWAATNIGSGYATPAVVGDRLFVQANEGTDNEFVQALTVAEGTRIW
jgi:outer membrane protein assembly factor BamB